MNLQIARVPLKSSHNLLGSLWSTHCLELFHTLWLYFIFWIPSTGLVAGNFRPAANGKPVVKGTPDNIFQGYREVKPEYVLAQNKFLEIWVNDPSKVEYLKTFKSVLFGGKVLKQSAGDALALAGVNLCNMYGSTESGQISSMPSSPQGKDWEYFELNPQYEIRFVDQGDGSYHGIVLGSEVQAPPVYNSKLQNEPAFATGDLLIPHPTKKNHWKVLGRIDDQIMMNTGEVVNPVRLENIISSNPYVDTCMMFGRGRPCLGVIIQLDQEALQGKKLRKEEVRDLVWPSVEVMNASSPANCRISKEMIILTSPSKPLVLNPKGAPKRPINLILYQPEIDEVYVGKVDVMMAAPAQVAKKVVKKKVNDDNAPQAFLSGRSVREYKL